MAPSQEQPVSDTSLLEYFGLTRPPFAALTDPSQIYPAEQYSLLLDHLASARKYADSLVVVCGSDGSGKSTLLDHFLASLDHHSLFVALNESCQSAEQFYCEILTQIGFEGISGSVNELHNITREFFRHRGNADDHVLIAIDNAHQVNLTVLEQLRRISEIKVENRRVLSVVLTGSTDLIRIIDAPAMKRTKFRSRVVFGIRNFTEEETASYVWHCLKLAGQNNGVNLPKEAHALIHRYSGGIPYAINKLCNDLLTEAHRLKSRVITEKIVRIVADKQQLVPHVAPAPVKRRRKSDPDFNRLRSVPVSEPGTEAGEPDEKSTPTGAVFDPEPLLRQVSQFSKQIDDLRADKTRALQDVDERNKDISQLRNELGAKSSEIESLKRFLDINVEKIDQQNQALSQSVAALQDREHTTEKLAADLEAETRTREAAASELTEVKATVDELYKLQQELQTQLKIADERAAQVEALEGNAADLRKTLGEKAGELDSRNQDLADIVKQLEESRNECASAKRRIATLKSPEEFQEIVQVSVQFAADLKEETRTREAAQSELAEAKATVGELNSLREELQSRDQTIGDFATRLRKSQKACKQAELRMVSLKSPREIQEIQDASDKLASDLEAETRARETAGSELDSLRQELQTRDQTLADLETRLEESQKEYASAERRIAALKSPDELQEVVKASDKLASDLEAEKRARETAGSELAEAKATVDELKQQLQTTVDELQAQLKVADERSVEIEALEKNTADLKDDIEGRVGELDSLREELESRDQACADLKARLGDSQNECEKLRRPAAASDSVKDAVSDADTAVSTFDTGIHPSHVVAKFDQSLRKVPAYQTLLDHDPAFYESLIAKYKELIGLDYTDKQINDALRTKQAKLIEKLLPRASDEALFAYARSIVDQLNEFHRDGTEPCFTLLVPQSDPNNNARLIYSEKTKESELETLDLTLRTYDTNRPLPTEEEVWPDLEPIFEELFEAYAEDNVSAMQDAYDPGIDRPLTCEISKTLYSEILGLSKRKAVRALRWLLAP